MKVFLQLIEQESRNRLIKCSLTIATWKMYHLNLLAIYYSPTDWKVSVVAVCIEMLSHEHWMQLHSVFKQSCWNDCNNSHWTQHWVQYQTHPNITAFVYISLKCIYIFRRCTLWNVNWSVWHNITWRAMWNTHTHTHSTQSVNDWPSHKNAHAYLY